MNATEPSGARLLVAPCDDFVAWDAFVRSAPDATFCHCAAWREIMADALRHEPICLVVRDERGTWHGVLPLVRVRSRLFGHYLVSMPFLNYGGPVGTREACRALVDAARVEAERSKPKLLELRCRYALAGSSLRVNARKVTVLLELPSGAEELWRAFPAKLRSQIRRSQKEGFQTRTGPGECAPFYEVFARHMHELGTPALPFSFFEAIRRSLPDAVRFAAVYDGTRPIAAGCGFVWREEFEITWASALRSYKRKAPNMLLYWSLMEEAIRSGVRVFNFGRCTPGAGTHRFKRQWGGSDVPLPWLQWSPAGATATPSPDRPVYRAAAAVWRRLPLRLTYALGPAVARCIP